MRFDLRQPCDKCPFRSDRAPYLQKKRVEGILNDLLCLNKTFPCHQTTSAGLGRRVLARNYQHCAGALIMVERAGKPNWRIRLADALGLYKPALLKMKSQIFSPKKMIEAQDD